MNSDSVPSHLKIDDSSSDDDGGPNLMMRGLNLKVKEEKKQKEELERIR